MHLYRALKIVIKKDSNFHRNYTFNELKQRKLLIKTITSLYEKFTYTRPLLITLYGIKSYLDFSDPSSQKGLFSIYFYKNEKRQLDYLKELMPGKQLVILKNSRSNYLNFKLWLEAFLVLLSPQYWKLVRRLSKKFGFLVALRTISTLFYYIRFKRVLGNSSFQGTLVSSDSNPYAMGLSFSALSLGLKTFYINHGHIPEGPPRLFFDYSFLDGPGLEDVYKRVAPIKGKVIYKGSEGISGPLNLQGLKSPSPVIGVFLSLITDWSKLIILIDQINEKFRPRKILLRLHPNEVIRDNMMVRKVKKRSFTRISTAETSAVTDLKECDFVIMGNCSAHLTALKFGVPTIHIEGIDDVTHDFYLFIEKEIHPYFESIESVDLNQVSKFYQKNWNKKFAYFDSNYQKSPLESEKKISDTFKEVLE